MWSHQENPSFSLVLVSGFTYHSLCSRRYFYATAQTSPGRSMRTTELHLKGGPHHEKYKLIAAFDLFV